MPKTERLSSCFKLHLAPCIDARPPCLPGRIRTLSAQALSILQGWARRELGACGPICFEEYVSMDSRLTPHVIHVHWIADGVPRMTRISESSDRLIERELEYTPNPFIEQRRKAHGVREEPDPRAARIDLRTL